MKKALYSTTFLASAGLLAFANAGDANAQAAAPAAEKLKISVGGFMSQWVGWTDIDRREVDGPQYKAFDQKSDSEIYFTGSVNLDNGMTVSVVAQLEIDNESTSNSSLSNGVTTFVTNQIMDESYLRISSATLGELRLGFQDPAAQALSVSAPWVGLNPYNSDTTVWLPRPGGSGAAPAAGLSSTAGGGDDNRVNYISPSIFGFRAAAGFTPSTSDTADQPTEREAEAWHTAIQWAGKFGDFGVRAYGGYWWIENPTTTTAGGTRNWSVGADVTFADFTVGGGFLETDNKRVATGIGDNVYVWNLGVKYAPGPFSLALTYMAGWSDQTVADRDEDEAQRVQLGASYLLGPGVNLLANVLWHDYTDETATTAAATSNSPSNWAVIAGIQVDF